MSQLYIHVFVVNSAGGGLRIQARGFSLGEWSFPLWLIGSLHNEPGDGSTVDLIA